MLATFGIGGKGGKNGQKGGKGAKRDGPPSLGPLGNLAFDIYARISMPEVMFEAKTLAGMHASPSYPILIFRSAH